MIGHGKYDTECTRARDEAEAAGALLIVMHGKHGNGFSASIPPVLAASIPGILRQIADQIDDSFDEA